MPGHGLRTGAGRVTSAEVPRTAAAAEMNVGKHRNRSPGEEPRVMTKAIKLLTALPRRSASA
ncbi:hypothetical protein SHKM778_40540 [Streptomyces sp. KM77-8]|uniref:Uncharacterized protein n=1 Tax=Streptomyces haneummycinicus TaxID=3074435 RepID=A0AAT9HJR5_9ACTN